MDKRLLVFMGVVSLMIFTGCETIARKDDVDVVKSRVSHFEDDFYATSRAIAERFNAMETNNERQFSEISRNIQTLSDKIDGISSDVSGLSRERALLSAEVSSVNSEIRKIKGDIDELDHKFEEELKKERASFQQKDFEVRRDIEGLKKTYNDIIISMASLSKNISAVQSDMAALNQSQRNLADAVNKISDDVEKNVSWNRAFQEKTERNMDVFLSEITRQESEIFKLREDMSAVKELASEQRVSQRETVTQTPSGERYYIVQRGDFLGRIASRHQTTVRAIKEANNLRSDTIYIGQRLIIP